MPAHPTSRTHLKLLAASLLSMFACVPALAAVATSKPAAADTYATKTRGLARHDGLFVTWRDAKAGKLLLELPAPRGERGGCARFLYIEGIQTGLGSNPVGLDRGQVGDTRVVSFRRLGAA
jgi:hypothetical protein